MGRAELEPKRLVLKGTTHRPDLESPLGQEEGAGEGGRVSLLRAGRVGGTGGSEARGSGGEGCWGTWLRPEEFMAKPLGSSAGVLPCGGGWGAGHAALNPWRLPVRRTVIAPLGVGVED